MPEVMGDNVQVGGVHADRLRSLVERIERPQGMRAGRLPVDRFIEKVSIGTRGCLEWTGSLSPQGYGWFSWNSKATLAHRWIYEAAHGPIPAKLVIDHLCRNRKCVNPAHLEAVPMAENTRRGLLHDLQRAKAKKQTHCKRGHPLFGENVSTNDKGNRCCKACRKMKGAEWKQLNRGRVNELQRLRRAGGCA